MGTAPEATIRIDSNRLPDRVELFAVDGDGTFSLRVPPSAQAVLQSDGSQPARRLRGAATAHAIPLGEASRGKILFGDVTIMFTVVPAPTASSAPTADAAVSARAFLPRPDFQFASILLAAGVVMTSLSAYARMTPYIEPSPAEALEDRWMDIARVLRSLEPPAAPAKAEEASEPKRADKGATRRGRRRRSPSRNRTPKSLVDAIDEAAAGGGAVRELFDSSRSVADMPIITAVRRDDSNPTPFRTRATTVDAPIGIESLGRTHVGPITTEPKAEVDMDGPIAVDGPVAGRLDEDKLAAKMRVYLRGVRDCYERALKRDPSLAGKIVLGLDILESGRVAEVDLQSDSINSPGVRSCVLRRAQRWRFAPPDGGSVFVEFPVVFSTAGAGRVR